MVNNFMRLKRIAIQAVLDLVSEQADANWPSIDKIERRFGIVGTGDAAQGRLDAQRTKWLKDWLERNTTWEQRLWNL